MHTRLSAPAAHRGRPPPAPAPGAGALHAVALCALNWRVLRARAPPHEPAIGGGEAGVCQVWVSGWLVRVRVRVMCVSLASRSGRSTMRPCPHLRPRQRADVGFETCPFFAICKGESEFGGRCIMT
jgi:hypothetical protein